MRARSADGGSLVQLTEDHTYEHLVSEASAVPNLPGKITRFLDGREDGRSPVLRLCLSVPVISYCCALTG